MSNTKPRPQRECANPNCDKVFAAWNAKQKYCSRDCIQAKGRTHLVCPCGANTGSYQKKYCSTEHREIYGKKKAPVEMIEHVCVCCGNTFERPHFYPGKKKYCSNACSHKQVKSVRDKFIADLPEGAVVFHSMWEVRFVAMCERFDIPWRSYDGPDIQTSVGIYRPDFIIETLVGERIVEVKGHLRPGNQEKIEEAGVWVVDQASLEALEGGDLSPLLDSPHPAMY